MHRLHSKSAIRRFRLAALLVCAKCLMAPVSLGWLAYSIVVHDRTQTLLALGALAATLVVKTLQWIVAARTHCPLCMTPVMGHKKCVKHRNAKTAFGSYRLRVALAILFRNSFRCPYCHEPTAMEVRNRGSYRSLPEG